MDALRPVLAFPCAVFVRGSLSVSYGRGMNVQFAALLLLFRVSLSGSIVFAGANTHSQSLAFACDSDQGGFSGKNLCSQGCGAVVQARRALICNVHECNRMLSLRGGGGVQSVWSSAQPTRTLVALGGTVDGDCALGSMESLWQDSPRRRSAGEVVQSWAEEKQRMIVCRDSLAAVSANHRIFAIGGYNGTDELSSVESIDLSCKKPAWVFEPRMRKRRSNVGGAIVGQRLYAVGGFNGTHDLPNVEVLQLDANGDRAKDSTWEWGPQMIFKRSGSALASIRGKLYVIGGYDGNCLLDTAEELDIDRGVWNPFPRVLNGRRGGAAAAAVAGRIYVIGGSGSEGRLSRMESIDPREGQWRAERPMETLRSGPAAIGIESTEQIWVAGGFDGQRQLDTVERYDVRKGTWLTEASLSCPRWGSAIVAPGLTLAS